MRSGCVVYLQQGKPNRAGDERKDYQQQGVGNCRPLFINIPDGKTDGIKLIPVGDIATKGEFAAIKGITAQDVLICRRFPAVLAGRASAAGGCRLHGYSGGYAHPGSTCRS